MKQEPRWIPYQAVVDLHKDQIAEYGGLPGIQKDGNLESALARPKQIFSYGGERGDISSLAAAYAWGISKNHPFVDGNKRMSLICIYVFLGLNGHYLDAREEDAYAIIVNIADGALDEEGLARWVKEHTFHINTV
ncbi:MAG: type II toxin-antitoxin system death-on-curing family toxin [Desulfarculaceae bacterium]|nr:type II toxin-antitoxin system death-on-curing family toxin [Desulfarculaceae bacterium]MCF8118307.1 type II toxin-antitoxin system death-on-curing family toxin [Desulfarculaceae bacterium]